MAESEKPPRIKSLIPALMVVREWTKFAVTSVIAAGTALFAAQRWIDAYATDAELKAHDDNPTAHQAITQDFADRIIKQAQRATELSEEVHRLEVQRQQDHQALYWSLWWRVGEKAAEVADPRKRQRAADDARDRFDAHLGRGMPLEEAYRRALGQGVP